MHVLIIPSWYPTSDRIIAGIFFREQVHALAKNVQNVGVIAPQLLSLRKFAIRNLRSSIAYENDQGIPTYRWQGMAWFPKVPYANNALWLRAGRQLFEKYIADHGLPDIIHAHSAINGGVLAACLGHQYKVPVVLTEHSSAFARGILYGWQKKLVSRAFLGSQRLIAVSPQLGALLGEEYPETASLWEWVPNMVEERFFDEPAPRDAMNSMPFRILNIALMTPIKGQRDLLKAFAMAFKGAEDAELCLGGNGPLRKELESDAERLGIRAQVKFLGMLTRYQVREALHNADMFVLASIYETFGVVVVEALAAGRPVIATRCGGPDCIIGEEDGVLVSPGDVNALADAMIEMRANIRKYNPDGLRARCRARFGENAVIKGLKTVYSGVLTNGRLFS
jgi:glycosyltransferase involved in cell wall biosynthesis